MAKFDLLFMS